MMKMWSKIFWEARILRTFSNFSTARCQARFAGLEDSSEYTNCLLRLKRTSAVSLSVISVSSRWKIYDTYFYKRMNEHAWVLEKMKQEEKKREKETMTPSSLIRGRIALDKRNGEVRAAFWRASKCSVLHPMDFAPYHRVSSGSSALCYHYC